MTPIFANQQCREWLAWTGFEDITHAVNEARRGNYSLVKSACKRALKIGVLAAACYGLYKICSSEPHKIVYSDLLTEAEKEYALHPSKDRCPTSVKELTDFLYHEQTSFKSWPQSGKDLVSKHLFSDAPMSSAIVKHFAQTSLEKQDSYLQRLITNTCSKDQEKSSKSCMSALETYAGKVKSPAEKKTFDDALSIVYKCAKRTNAFCSGAFKRASDQALQMNSVKDVRDLVEKTKKIPVFSSQKFYEDATRLFPDHWKDVAELKRIAAQCRLGKEDEDETIYNYTTYQSIDKYTEKQKQEILKAREICFTKATSWENSYYRDSSYWERLYCERKEKTLLEEAENLLEDGKELANLCQRFPGSKPCAQFIKQYDLLSRA